jgi:hypothetical protein
LIDASPLPERIIVCAILNDMTDDEELAAHLRIERRQLEAGNRSGMFPEQRPVAVGTSRGDERVRRIDPRWGLYAYLLQDRTELVPEPACGILRLPHIDNA